MYWHHGQGKHWKLPRPSHNGCTDFSLWCFAGPAPCLCDERTNDLWPYIRSHTFVMSIPPSHTMAVSQWLSVSVEGAFQQKKKMKKKKTADLLSPCQPDSKHNLGDCHSNIELLWQTPCRSATHVCLRQKQICHIHTQTSFDQPMTNTLSG